MRVFKCKVTHFQDKFSKIGSSKIVCFVATMPTILLLLSSPHPPFRDIVVLIVWSAFCIENLLSKNTFLSLFLIDQIMLIESNWISLFIGNVCVTVALSVSILYSNSLFLVLMHSYLFVFVSPSLFLLLPQQQHISVTTSYTLLQLNGVIDSISIVVLHSFNTIICV